MAEAQVATEPGGESGGGFEEFEHEPVPSSRRRSLPSVALVWLGFPMIMTGAVTGASIVAGLGFSQGMWAILAGNLVLFAYVASLSAIAGRSGRNFPLQAARAYGERGYVVASGLLATIVVGWFAVQSGLAGADLHDVLGWNTLAVTVACGVLYLLATLLGIKALSWIGAISAPLFVILGVIALALVLQRTTWAGVTGFAGNPQVHLTFGAAVTLVIALFADSGTMTGDFTRWSRNAGQAVTATFFAFPFANFVAMLFGAVVAAAGLAADGDFSVIVSRLGPVGLVAAVALLVINLGSVCSHCLYNAAVGWSHITGGRFRPLAVVLGIIGVGAAALGVWNVFIPWLNLLGIVVPPIGAIMLASQLLPPSGRSVAVTPGFRGTSFVAWLLASGAAFAVNFTAPYLCTAFVGMIVGAGLQLLLSRLRPSAAASSLGASAD